LAENSQKADAHDFRCVERTHGRLLIFELELPHGTQKAESDKIMIGLKERIRMSYPDCNIKINIEFGFVAEE
jgi:hypothetical protein